MPITSPSERLSLYILTVKEKSATMCAEGLNQYKLKEVIKLILKMKDSKGVSIFIQMPWQTMMHQVIYKNKLETKYTLTPIDPRLLYVGAIRSKGYLSFRDTCTELYSYQSVLCVLYLAACGAKGHLSVLYSVGQLPTGITQLFAYHRLYLYYFSTIFINFL